jgi:hypothetical protein
VKIGISKEKSVAQFGGLTLSLLLTTYTLGTSTPTQGQAPRNFKGEHRGCRNSLEGYGIILVTGDISEEDFSHDEKAWKDWWSDQE